MQKTLQTPTQVQFCSLDIRIGAFWPYCKSRKVSSCSNPNPPHKEKGWCLSNKEDLVQNVPTLGNPCILALAKRPQLLAWQIPLEVTFFLAFQNLIFLWLCRCDTSQYIWYSFIVWKNGLLSKAYFIPSNHPLVAFGKFGQSLALWGHVNWGSTFIFYESNPKKQFSE